ncbi:hypothetical protein [Micromonospora sp. NPDC050200]|uniref:hypothetical protein n=1 Tax=Micromonospora sp. NPDC050200 TaxID=3155664 RepID=UPI0033CF220C
MTIYVCRLYASRSHRIALFDRSGMRFVLVPGRQPMLGYDGSRFQPAPDQADSYAEGASTRIGQARQGRQGREQPSGATGHTEAGRRVRQR